MLKRFDGVFLPVQTDTQEGEIYLSVGPGVFGWELYLGPTGILRSGEFHSLENVYESIAHHVRLGIFRIPGRPHNKPTRVYLKDYFSAYLPMIREVC